MLSMYALQATATGRSGKNVREYLEKNFEEDMDEADCVKLGVKVGFMSVH